MNLKEYFLSNNIAIIFIVMLNELNRMYRIRRSLGLIFYVLPLIIVSCTNQYEQPKQLVFILAGQSNMAGASRTSELTASFEHLLHIPTNIKLHKRRAKQGYFGPEISLIHEISRIRSDQECIFIKFTVNATSLLAWDPEWTPEKARITKDKNKGPVYPRFIKFVRNHTRDKNVQFETMFWMQGERDARYPEAGRMYMQNFQKLIHRIRSDLNTPDLPILCGQINPPHAKFPAVEIVRNAQAQTAKKVHNVKLISTEGLEKRADQIHYNFAGQIELGKRFAAAYSEMVERVNADEK